jgi:hypothetical protein
MSIELKNDKYLLPDQKESLANLIDETYNKKTKEQIINELKKYATKPVEIQMGRFFLTVNLPISPDPSRLPQPSKQLLNKSKSKSKSKTVKGKNRTWTIRDIGAGKKNKRKKTKRRSKKKKN